MPKRLIKPKITFSHKYEEMGAKYQICEIALLNSVLKSCGIHKKKRRRICEEFVFAHGVFLDEGGIVEGKNNLSPVICFVERNKDSTGGMGDIRALHLPDEAFSYHEYAFGNMDYFFDSQKEKAGFDWGPRYNDEE